MWSRYNFKLVEKHQNIDLTALPVPKKEYGEKSVFLYGVDAVRFSGFEELESPSGGLKFLNKIWNLQIKRIEPEADFKNGVDYYMNKAKYHNVIALVRKEINKNGVVSPFMIDTLYPFIPYITTKMKENENYK